MSLLDVVIIGGGPIGIACGLEAKKKGLTYVILEKGPIVNSIYNYPANMQFFSSSERLEIDNIPFISIEAKPKRNEALEYYRRIVTGNNLNIKLFEEVIDVKKEEGLFHITSSKNSYTASQIVIATGFYDIPNLLRIPGEDLEKVTHYYKNPHYYSGQKVAVVGASNSSVDAALECWRKGADVTLIIRESEIGSRVKYWVRPDIINRIEEGSIKVYYHTTVKEITPNKITIASNNGKEDTLENDFVIALTGYRPNFKFLELLGVSLSNDEKKLPHYNPGSMESNIPGIYLAGVVCGGMQTHKWFIENSRIHATLIMASITQNK